MVVEEQPNLPSGSLLLLNTGLVMGGIAIISLAIEILTGRWLAKAIDLPVFISLPLGVGTGILMVLTWRSKNVRPTLITTLFVTYFTIFFIALFWAPGN